MFAMMRIKENVRNSSREKTNKQEEGIARSKACTVVGLYKRNNKTTWIVPW